MGSLAMPTQIRESPSDAGGSDDGDGGDDAVEAGRLRWK